MSSNLKTKETLTFGYYQCKTINKKSLYVTIYIFFLNKKNKRKFVQQKYSISNILKIKIST